MNSKKGKKITFKKKWHCYDYFIIKAEKDRETFTVVNFIFFSSSSTKAPAGRSFYGLLLTLQQANFDRTFQKLLH
jgi:hypothetical protein